MKNKSILIALATLFITINGIAQTKTVTDVDGNVYNTITIGTQTWMAENLRTTRYNNGDTIPNITDCDSWATLLTPAMCTYRNTRNADSIKTYGRLYNWNAVKTGKLAPKGWHVPTNAEWTTLITYLGGESVAGGKLKETGITHWLSPNNGADNSTGFTALGGGNKDSGSGFSNFGLMGNWWSSSDSCPYKNCTNYNYAWSLFIVYYSSSIGKQYVPINFGFSVRCIKSNTAQLSITSPALGETVLADAPYSIQWNSSGIDSVKIDYSLDNGKTFHKITSGIPADAGSFSWHVPDTLASKCKLVITNLDDPSDTVVLSNFRIKGYVLTRFKANGDFEAYDPKVHGWQFANDGSVMWPRDWWEKFDYRGTDPITGKPYHPYFTSFKSSTSYGVNAVNSDFPDWPLFAQTFGIDQCYTNISTPIYKLIAFRYWGLLKKGWNGSCFGFATSSLLEFDFPNAFRASFPELGSYSNLIELPLNDYRRAVINQLYLYQFSIVDYEWFDSMYRNSPRATLQNAKDNFLTPIRNHSTLYMDAKYTSEGKHGGHSLLPYALKRIPNTASQYELLVYDSNCPSGNCKNHSKPAIIIDSLNNSWSYPPQGWNSGESSMGIYFDAPVNTFLQRPIFPNKDSLGIKARVVFMDKSKSTIAISNLAGNAIGFAHKIVNTIPGGYPIIPKTDASDTSDVPIGYVIPSGLYSITLNSFQDSITSVGVFGNSSVFSYWRNDAVDNQTDRLTYNEGLVFRNPDIQTKKVNLEAITQLTECESGFQFLNCKIGQNDSVRLETTANNRVALVNMGPAKTYDLNIVKTCDSLSGQFNHDSITLPAHSTHFIVIGLPDLSQNHVKIYEDIGSMGNISDSLIITNQFKGLANSVNTGIDDHLSLIQNYPNPFQTTTTIKYRITEPGFVSLKVFDTMGKEVANLVKEQKPVGDYSIEWNAAQYGGGIYFCQLKNGCFLMTKKMLLIK
jgi:uncharacterized protein (TIGR02145 family)